jgi:hypothetical protein
VRPAQFPDVDLRQPGVADLSLALQFRERAERLGNRDLAVLAVQLEQIDAVDAEVAQAQLGLWTQVFGAGRSRAIGPGPGGSVRPSSQ